MTPLGKQLRFPWLYARLTVLDAAQNWRYARGDRRFLVVRHPRVAPFFYDLLLDWLARCFPDVRALFELHPLPWRVRDWSRYALHAAWLQDPVQRWSPSAYRWAHRLGEACDRHGVPVVNRVDRLVNAVKSTSARLIATAGIRTAKMAPITDAEEFRASRLGIPLPLFVREDWGHGGPLLRADTEAEARALPIERFAHPVAVEHVDVRSPSDGLYRKYRYVVCGDRGVAQSLHVGRDWCVRGGPERTVYTDDLRDEEIAFTSRPEPNHARFVAARRALGLDFVAFDYGFDRDGELVVWEANPYPYLHVVAGRRAYRNGPTTRVLAAMTAMYLDRARLPLPDGLEDVLARTP